MNRYRVYLRGENFLLEGESGPERLGFYTHRFVDAETANQAEQAAVELLRDDESLQDLLNERSDPPLLFAEEVQEVGQTEGAEGRIGLAFFRS